MAINIRTKDRQFGDGSLIDLDRVDEGLHDSLPTIGCFVLYQHNANWIDGTFTRRNSVQTENSVCPAWKEPKGSPESAREPSVGRQPTILGFAFSEGRAGDPANWNSYSWISHRKVRSTASLGPPNSTISRTFTMTLELQL